MNKQELIEKYKNKYPVISMDIKEFRYFTELWEDVKQLDEPQKVTVPKFVAEWIEKGKKELSLRDLMSRSYTTTEVGNWLGELDKDGGFKNQETFAKAVLCGYTIEKEKRYTVKMKNLRALFCYLAYVPDEGYWSLMASGGKSIIIKHTRKELEEAGFGEVFNSPLFEIEEVEV